jgi:hypothetical protein
MLWFGREGGRNGGQEECRGPQPHAIPKCTQLTRFLRRYLPKTSHVEWI